MSGVRQAQQQLQSRWNALRQQWSTSSSLWIDDVRRRFASQHWQEWERIVPSVLSEMQRLDQVLEQARREVR